MNLQTYLSIRTPWKPVQLPFKGPESFKKFVEHLKESLNLSTQGEALDYIRCSFEYSKKETEQLTAKVTELETQNSNLQATVTELRKLLDESKAKEGSSIPIQYPDKYTALKEATEKQLPLLFAIEGKEKIEVTDTQFIALLVDYCERDPSNEFPFEPIAKEIVEKAVKS